MPKATNNHICCACQTKFDGHLVFTNKEVIQAQCKLHDACTVTSEIEFAVERCSGAALIGKSTDGHNLFPPHIPADEDCNHVLSLEHMRAIAAACSPKQFPPAEPFNVKTAHVAIDAIRSSATG